MTDTELSTFDPAVADAVVAVLRRHGLPAWTTAAPERRGEPAVHVPADQRETAFAVLAEHMEQVNDELADRRPLRPAAATTAADSEAGNHGERPLVMERFRRLGVSLAVLLAPLLIISLARPPFPLTLTLITLVAGMAAVVALRERRARRGPSPGR